MTATIPKKISTETKSLRIPNITAPINFWKNERQFSAEIPIYSRTQHKGAYITKPQYPAWFIMQQRRRKGEFLLLWTEKK